VINMDMLGRDFFDVVQHAVFVAGVERYPALREDICRFGAQAGIRILPLGTDLIGPRSDHVAFEPRGVPCLFFSCGTFSDYHKPTDTADKLNYEDLERSAKVVLGTVREIATCPRLEPAVPSESGYAAELRTVCAAMSEINQNPARAGVKPDDAGAFERFAHEAEDLLSKGSYDRHSREKLIIDASGILAPYFLPSQIAGKAKSAEEQNGSKQLMKYLYAFYLRYGPQIMEGYRGLVAQLLKYHPGPVRGMPRFYYQFYDIADDDISLSRQAENKYALNVLGNSWTMTAEVKSSKWLLKSFNAYIGSSLDAMDCEGTLEQVTDYCLLRLRRDQTNAPVAAAIRKVLRTVSGKETPGPYQELLQARLQRGGFKDETDWLVDCILEGTPDLAILAIDEAGRNPGAGVLSSVCQVLADTKMRPDVRAAAIHYAGKIRNDKLLAALCDLVPDPTPVCRREFFPILSKSYPFSERPVVEAARPIVERQIKESLSETLGGLSRGQLKRVTKRDFGKDPQRWRDRLQTHPFS